jgi:PAS domain S-box-containing protein
MRSDVSDDESRRADEMRVLLLPPTVRDAQALQKLLSDAAIPCVVCPSVPALCAEFDAGVGAVLISEEAITGDSAQLVHCLRDQPVWSDIGTIVLSRSGPEVPKLSAMVPLLGNVAVLERPLRTTTLLSVVRSSLRARKRQYQLRDHLDTLGRAQADLRNSEERLRLAVQTGKLGVWELNLETLDLQCSAACKANFGRAPDDPFTYADLHASLHPDDVERVRSAIRESLEGDTEYDTEYRCIWPDGSVHWILARGRRSWLKGEPVQRMIGVTLDVTERRAAEERLGALLHSESDARAQAELASRMKDEFLATLSHELRTPLNAILGWSQILAQDTRGDPDLAEGLLTIERNARAQTQIIEDLLDMSRIVSGKVRLDVQRVDLPAIVQAAVDTVKPTANAKGVRLQLVLDSMPHAEVMGDPSRLQQIFWNLLTNAIKFTPRGERVQVVLQRVDSHLEVGVIDSGEGIAPEFLPHVFDRFRQADASTTRRHGGLGLGLAIVRQLVELHGGTIRAESEGRGRGARFLVELPAAAVRAEARHAPRSRHPRAQNAVTSLADATDDLSGIRVLVLDDQVDSRLLVKRLLEDRQAIVLTAATPGEAIDVLQSEKPDVLVSDIGMPGEDGYSFIRKVRMLPRASGGETPAVALTAYARVEDRVNATRAGFQQHIAKPVEPVELITVIATLARRPAP